LILLLDIAVALFDCFQPTHQKNRSSIDFGLAILLECDMKINRELLNKDIKLAKVYLRSGNLNRQPQGMDSFYNLEYLGDGCEGQVRKFNNLAVKTYDSMMASEDYIPIAYENEVIRLVKHSEEALDKGCHFSPCLDYTTIRSRPYLFMPFLQTESLLTEEAIQRLVEEGGKDAIWQFYRDNIELTKCGFAVDIGSPEEENAKLGADGKIYFLDPTPARYPAASEEDMNARATRFLLYGLRDSSKEHGNIELLREFTSLTKKAIRDIPNTKRANEYLSS